VKIPSRFKLEKELARLKAAAQKFGARSDSGKSASATTYTFRVLKSFILPLNEAVVRCVSLILRNLSLPRFPSWSQGRRIRHDLGGRDIGRLIQVIRDEPRFFSWFMYLRVIDPDKRNRELDKMSDAMSLDPDNEDLTDILSILKAPAVYEAFCQTLQSERNANA